MSEIGLNNTGTNAAGDNLNIDSDVQQYLVINESPVAVRIRVTVSGNPWTNGLLHRHSGEAIIFNTDVTTGGTIYEGIIPEYDFVRFQGSTTTGTGGLVIAAGDIDSTHRTIAGEGGRIYLVNGNSRS